jgi:hypothetical protein
VNTPDVQQWDMTLFENVLLDNDQLNGEEILVVLHQGYNPIRSNRINLNKRIQLKKFTSSDISEICTSAPLHFPNTRISVADISKARSSVGIKSVMMVDLIFSFHTRKGDRRNESKKIIELRRQISFEIK